jgi:hypothetical protein
MRFPRVSQIAAWTVIRRLVYPFFTNREGRKLGKTKRRFLLPPSVWNSLETAVGELIPSNGQVKLQGKEQAAHV